MIIMLSVTLVKLLLVIYMCRTFTDEILKAYAHHFFDITNVIELVALLSN